MITHNFEKMKFSGGYRLCQTWLYYGAPPRRFALRHGIRKLISMN
jgi:hypothetical protein